MKANLPVPAAAKHTAIARMKNSAACAATGLKCRTSWLESYGSSVLLILNKQKMSLRILNLKVKVEQKLILSGINLEIKPGEIQALMGPNGSGKSTLACALMGHPHYHISQGRIFLDSRSIEKLPSEQRAKLGLFLSFQHSVGISGVSVRNFLRASLKALKGEIDLQKFLNDLDQEAKLLKMPLDFAKRSLNEGLSGGEIKRLEILQLLMLKPRYAILDEIDSGLDIDALRIVSRGILRAQKLGVGVLIITHYSRILKYLQPDKIHVLIQGKIIKSGGKDLAKKLEKTGYEAWAK